MIAAVPGEFTTMAGRRFRNAINLESETSGGLTGTKTIIAGLSNVYTHYVTTFEEYQVILVPLISRSFFKLFSIFRFNATKLLP